MGWWVGWWLGWWLGWWGKLRGFPEENLLGDFWDGVWILALVLGERAEVNKFFAFHVWVYIFFEEIFSMF